MYNQILLIQDVFMYIPVTDKAILRPVTYIAHTFANKNIPQRVP
jgi:hypothetical protein